ncbi:hypothetical protein [Parageobacillus thermoglucosidasius]|uniref:hypothetical protein n=1 Tax=Parageobacillus thermoglucosidasius TaxID=1426 RepID=UPI0021AB8C69|nr:hypothetical protein [Parageobacillus thermoglucosidasius]MED4904116.1 hypothetical protein [Parageobacillus thermoglucosidasius]MED4915666.1 hypothetical protein [Parageobacillus thermoglucosidasius]MED4945069.1 hypothetical protein [Parageobacillus thermoglucosidasius]MED4983734.1 hypothetical protein [Parageobacillus thermoglucosidasius]
MINYERAMEILKNRIEMAEKWPDMDAPDEWWEEMPKILSRNQKETEKFLEERTSKELFFLGEIFEDIAYEFKTDSFIQFLWNLHKKHPKAELEEDIKRAEEAI